MLDIKRHLRDYLQPSFLICVAVLAIAGVGMSAAKKAFKIILKKEPCPLVKSLDLLADDGLAPYEIVNKRIIENEEIVEALGTEDYIQWVLEDTQAVSFGTPPKMMLFITYYRLPDRVPHVPEVCYTGGGYQRLKSDGVVFEINNDDGFERTIPGRYLLFGRSGGGFSPGLEEFPVLYFFRVNGEYVGSRDAARMALGNIFRKAVYFSKIEFVFNQSATVPDKDGAVAACEKLLSVILPILEAEHWPDG